MTAAQRTIKYCAIAFAVFLIVAIVAGIMRVLGGLSVLIGGKKETPTGSMQTYPVPEETVTSLDIDIGAASLIIETGESISVESDSENLSVKAENGKLRVTEKSKNGNLFRNSEAATVRITLPADASYEKIKIDTGAGRVNADTLRGEHIDLNLGAGEVRIGTLIGTQKVKIDGGAGAITVCGGSMNDADIDIGMGDLSVTAGLSGKCKLEYGMGECSLKLVGKRDDYRISLDRGLGSATLDGESMKDGATYGNGATTVDIDGGMGKLSVSFTEH